MNFGLLDLAGKWIGLTVVSVMSLFNGNTYVEREICVNNKNITKDIKVESVITPYKTIVQNNSKLPSGTTNVLVEGKEGITYVTGGKEEVIQEKVDKVVEKGTGAVGAFTGRLSGYGPDCAGCSGYGGLACRTKNGGKHNLVQDGIYYEDSEYGKVRIIAAALKKFPCGTIMQITKPGKDPFMAVVLDTGATMVNKWNEGIMWVDLAYASEKDKTTFGIDGLTGTNIKFEVKRWGW